MLQNTYNSFNNWGGKAAPQPAE